MCPTIVYPECCIIQKTIWMMWWEDASDGVIWNTCIKWLFDFKQSLSRNSVCVCGNVCTWMCKGICVCFPGDVHHRVVFVYFLYVFHDFINHPLVFKTVLISTLLFFFFWRESSARSYKTSGNTHQGTAFPDLVHVNNIVTPLRKMVKSPRLQRNIAPALTSSSNTKRSARAAVPASACNLCFHWETPGGYIEE